VTRPYVSEYIGAEAAATRISIFETMVVPGALQTRDYAAAVLAGQPPAALEHRLARQLPAETAIVLDESVLHRPYGGVDALRGQASALLEATRREEVNIQILPMVAAVPAAADGPFSIIYSGRGAVGFTEHAGGGSWIRVPDDIRRLEAAFAVLRRAAMTPAESQSILNKIVDG
jgi:hypothetical protein